MAIWTDSIDAVAALLPAGMAGDFALSSPGGRRQRAAIAAGSEGALAPLLRAVFEGAQSLYRAPADVTGWRAILVLDHAHGSQYDLLIRLLRAGVALPDRVACLARTGSGMHGFRGRPWRACAGNIHLVVHFAPNRAIERFGPALTALAAVAAAEAADSVLADTQHRARIKWVNDILVADRKVGGVLAFTQTRDAVVTSAVLGIGLNVESTPAVERSPYVPAAGSLKEVAPSCRAAHVLPVLLDALVRNRELLLHGGPAALLDAYRARSATIGEHVTVVSDDVAADILAEGRVTGIGDGLELLIDGRAEPVTRGRLLLAARGASR
jgi:BirA family biotin operon repressor/biotin-[acetyl-CoA-carboxylase] ligase